SRSSSSCCITGSAHAAYRSASDCSCWGVLVWSGMMALPLLRWWAAPRLLLTAVGPPVFPDWSAGGGALAPRPSGGEVLAGLLAVLEVQGDLLEHRDALGPGVDRQRQQQPHRRGEPGGGRPGPGGRPEVRGGRGQGADGGPADPGVQGARQAEQVEHPGGDQPGDPQVVSGG